MRVFNLKWYLMAWSDLHLFPARPHIHNVLQPGYKQKRFYRTMYFNALEELNEPLRGYLYNVHRKHIPPNRLKDKQIRTHLLKIGVLMA